MLPPNLQSPREVTLYYDNLYAQLTTSNTHFHPFLYPQAGLAAFLVLGYLLIDHRRSAFLRWLRLPVFGFLCVFQGWCVLTNKAKHPAAAFGVGLLSAWGVLWVGTIMVVRDCQGEFVRLERGKGGEGADGHRDGSMGHGAAGKDAVELKTGKEALNGGGGSSELSKEAEHGLYWQGYPSNLLSRLDWVADAFCNFRGVGWNWQSSAIPPLPSPSQHATTPAYTTSKTGIRRFHSRAPLLRSTLIKVVVGYLALDLIKTLMHHDPYFWGYTSSPPPTHLLRSSPTLIKSYRLLLSLAGIYTALRTIFALGPLFFCWVLGPSSFIHLRGEAIMNPAEMFGSVGNVAESGLAGWWGGFWHQTFRYAFEAPAHKLLEVLGWDQKSTKGRMTSLFLAFFLSGCLHACGSYTQLGDTRPIMGPMRFFLLQPVGIVIQTALMKQLPEAVTRNRYVRRTVNVGFTLVWLYYTAPLLVDDFAQGGVWLFEPIAVSPLRAMGWGPKDDTWFCWWNGVIFWRTGKGWWDTGIAI